MSKKKKIYPKITKLNWRQTDDLCLFLLYESVSNDQTKEKRKENMSGIVHGSVGLSQV